MNERLYWIWLSRIRKLGSIKIQSLLNEFKTPENIFNATKKELIEIEGINEKTADEILNEKYRRNLDQYLKYMKNNNIGIITIYDKEYPEKLNKIYDKPIVLYIKGNKNILNDFSLAIVGCRKNSLYGEKVASDISYNLSKEGVVVVSGLARGIDSIAHKGCLNANGKTIAVVGNGLDNIYPYENQKLADEIIKNGGLIISEYIIGTKPEKMNFPARNRIISGLSDGVVVIEAKLKSGTMITVDFTLEQGKEVFAVPGDIINENSEGTNELIKQGAKLVTNYKDIIDEFI